MSSDYPRAQSDLYGALILPFFFVTIKKCTSAKCAVVHDLSGEGGVV